MKRELSLPARLAWKKKYGGRVKCFNNRHGLFIGLFLFSRRMKVSQYMKQRNKQQHQFSPTSCVEHSCIEQTNTQPSTPLHFPCELFTSLSTSSPEDLGVKKPLGNTAFREKNSRRWFRELLCMGRAANLISVWSSIIFFCSVDLQLKCAGARLGSSDESPLSGFFFVRQAIR